MQFEPVNFNGAQQPLGYWLVDDVSKVKEEH